jgi:hypothetical protein
MRTHIFAIGILFFSLGASQASAITFTTLDYPGATSTQLTGVSDGRIVGNGSGHGFVYDGTTFTELLVPSVDPDITGPFLETQVNGIDANNIVGSYNNEVELIFDTTELPITVRRMFQTPSTRGTRSVFIGLLQAPRTRAITMTE